MRICLEKTVQDFFYSLVIKGAHVMVHLGDGSAMWKLGM